MPEPLTYPERPGSTRKKWYAVIIVVILILSSLLLIAAVHPARSQPSISVDSASNYLIAGDNYTLKISANHPFNNITVLWGDKSEAVLNYSSTTVALTHEYKYPGVYYISYFSYFGSYLFSSNQYIPVYVSPSSVSNDSASGILNIINSTNNPAIQNSYVYPDGTGINVTSEYTQYPLNGTFNISNQKLSVYSGKNLFIGASNNSSKPNLNYFIKNITGLYILELKTETSNGTASFNSTYYLDVVGNSNSSLYLNVNNSVVFDSQSPVTNLNPYLATSQGDLEILYNTELLLYGNISNHYFPEIAKSMTDNGKSYIITINTDIEFNNGVHVTVYDVYYSLILDILMENKTPQSPGWILAQYLFTGNYHNANTFSNITKAISYSNTTGTITLNFTSKLSNNTVERILSSPGTFITDSSNMSQLGLNLTFTSNGFNYFKTHEMNINVTYMLSDGPYFISKFVPGEYLELSKNPDFNGMQNDPETSLNSITVKYENDLAEEYQDMRLNTTQISEFPSYYKLPYVSSFTNYSYNMSEIYAFNANVNLSVLARYVDSYNFPSNFFSNLTVRESGSNPMPLYETVINTGMNKSFYYSYLGSTFNYSYAFQNGFSLYTFNVSHENQSIIMNGLNQNITEMINYNKNYSNVTSLFNQLTMYITTNNTVRIEIYSQPYLSFEPDAVSYGNIVLFNKIVESTALNH